MPLQARGVALLGLGQGHPEFDGEGEQDRLLAQRVAHQAQRLGAVGLLGGAEVEVQAHQLLELEQHFAGLVLADFQGAVDVQLRAEVFLADHAQVERPGEFAAASRQGVLLGFLDLLQGVDQHLVVVAVPGLLDVRDALAEVVEVGGRERAAENQ